jgi:pimeloyl-ACP methyl ester carboxylesterase
MKKKIISTGLTVMLLLVLLVNGAYSQQRNSSKIKQFVSEYASVNGVRLHYVKAGNGKKLIVFLHGFPEFWYEYKNQLEEFSKSGEYTVVAPDMRGFNLSSKPDSVKEYQVKYVIEDLRQLAEKLGYKKFTLVGHDWGGVIAWWFAIVNPNYLDKLVIINAPHPTVFQRELARNPEQQKASTYIKFFCSDQAEHALSMNNYKGLFDSVFGDDLKARNFTSADQQEYLKAWSQPGALTASLNYYRASFGMGSGLNPPSYQVNVPTLVIWGEKDKYLMISNLTGLEKYVPNLTVKKIPDASHWVIHEQPLLVNQYIKDFIR